MNETKVMLVESLRLLLKDKPEIGNDEFNLLTEFAPYSANLITKAYGLNIGELRALIQKNPILLQNIEIQISRSEEI